MRETCLGVLTLKNFTVVSTLAAYGGFSYILSLHVVHNKIFFTTFTNNLDFLLHLLT